MAASAGQKNHVVGIDLGGTKILSAVVDREGNVLSRAKKKTKAQRTSDEILLRLEECSREAIEASGVPASEIAAVGIGSPGPLDPITGCILETPNLNLSNAPIAPYLIEKLAMPVFLDNDVNVGTFGEFTYGAAKGKQHVIGIFLGTGVGGGVILNGEPFHGASLNAGELGHTKIVAYGDKCGCGDRGCLEAYASKTAMIKRIKKRISKGKKSILTDLTNGDWTKLTSSVFVKAIEANDKITVNEIHRASKYTGVAVGSLMNILSPEMVVIGGGLVEALEAQIMPDIRYHAERNCFPIMSEKCEIVPAMLGDDAGILGAAAIAWKRLESA
ncbi:MAG: ROK family protein [Candidatus Hinthialibacter antarcticus]|nr:ROK family protein [Candidatus Hinthialibacter antarcticus]